MLRVGLTGDLGSGKTTVARQLARRGAFVLSSDEMARTMMQPGEDVYAEIVEHFGPGVLAPDHTLDRRKLAALAFDAAHPRVEELNAIIHPAVIRAQEEHLVALEQQHPEAVAVVESALIFSTRYGSAHSGTTSPEFSSPGSHSESGNLVPPSGQSACDAEQPHSAAPGWRSRFDCVLLVTAPEREKIDRFVGRMAAGRELSAAERAALAQDAADRLALQDSARHAAECIVIHNDHGFTELEEQVDAAWHKLQQMEKTARFSGASKQSGAAGNY